MPHYFLYVEIVVVLWIVVQIVTGKAMYRHKVGSRRDNPRAFWLFIGLEALIVAPALCLQVGWTKAGEASFLLLATGLLGVALWAIGMSIYVIATRGKELWSKLAANPKKALKFLFFGIR